MAVVYPSDLHGPEAWWASGVPRECFYCGGPTLDHEPAVYWSGATAVHVALHGACAERLAVHLIGDARELLLAAGPPPWPGRVVDILRHALQRQEAVE